MAIDFSQVKTITIPEGSVTKITDSNGNILWKAQTEGWHTVFEGSWSHTWSYYSNKVTTKICDLVVSDKPLKLRITGSINTTLDRPSGSLTWIGESPINFDRPKLPLIINKETTPTNTGVPSSDSKIILDFKMKAWDIRYSTEFHLKVNPNSIEFIFVLLDNYMGFNQSLTATLNITKVEQYY